tara:strand:- start:17 stop:769 length:753 start_codon:yes stop_codon:yes gene_type:complete
MSKYIANDLFNDKISIYVTECLSTNDFLINLLKKDKIKEGDSVISDFQYKGRGQRTNNWISEKKSNILFSFLLSPDLKVENQFYLHVIISLAILKCLKEFDINPKIKWPNDIYVNKKKIAGILIENFIFKKKVQNSIIGIGLNLNQKIFNNVSATSVFIERKKKIDKKNFILVLKKFIASEYKDFKTNIKKKINQYKIVLYGLNQIKKYKISSGVVDAKVVDISSNGDIILNIKDKEKIFSHGSLSLLED